VSLLVSAEAYSVMPPDVAILGKKAKQIFELLPLINRHSVARASESNSQAVTVPRS
jgi:hypothetical protein